MLLSSNESNLIKMAVIAVINQNICFISDATYNLNCGQFHNISYGLHNREMDKEKVL